MILLNNNELESEDKGQQQHSKDIGNEDEYEEEEEKKEDVIVNSDYEISEEEENGNKEAASRAQPRNNAPNDEYAQCFEEMNEMPLNEATWEISDDDEDSDRLPSDVDSSGDEEEGQKKTSKRKWKKTNFKQFKKETDLRNPEFRIGMQFANKDELKETIREYAIVQGKNIKLVKKDNKRIQAKCTGHTKCPFILWASKIDTDEQTFAIKTLSLEHECTRVDKLKYINSRWLSKRFADKIRKNPEWDVGAFKAEVLEKYHMNVSKHHIYRAKTLSKVIIGGSYVEQYARLWDYVEELKKANKGSTVIIKNKMKGNKPVFERIYVCLETCKRGFSAGCRPLIGIDGCHLKRPYTGQVLTAVSVDGNNGLYPVAYAVVEVESKSSWIWFLQLLIEDLQIENGKAWVFMNDKQKGLILAIETLLPTAEHKMCVRHLYSNFRIEHAGLALKNILWAAAKATTIPWYEAEMDKMKEQNEKAWKWLKKRPAKNWSRSHFEPHSKCDLLLNNLCESFNSCILDSRDKSILTCLERIRVYIMLRMANRRIAGTVWRHPVGPRIVKIIEKNKLGASQCIPRLVGESKYQVSHMYGGEYVVDLKAKTCSCRRWDLCGIPCSHAISCIFQKEANVFDYTHDCYKKEAYLSSYEPMVHPIPSMDQWQRTNWPPIIPPPYKKQPGRPKKSRNKGPADVEVPAPVPPNPLPPFYNPPPTRLRRIYVKIRCSICGQERHNNVFYEWFVRCVSGLDVIVLYLVHFRT
ncbi:uncharacterized protein LOC18790575 [Prunus persica]|uniref:uncharacterized protein LOC18790575 n=1 Tax=Prunus persica TaxID=3760 RepID=UPI0009AB576E|nr:uncharacterized protein LOC18790575 [Prunus persica]